MDTALAFMRGGGVPVRALGHQPLASRGPRYAPLGAREQLLARRSHDRPRPQAAHGGRNERDGAAHGAAGAASATGSRAGGSVTGAGTCSRVVVTARGSAKIRLEGPSRRTTPMMRLPCQ